MTSNDRPTPPERFSVPAIFRAFIESFDVDKGFIKTYRLLATSPGKSIRTYLMDDRSILTKPMRLLLVSTAIVSFITLQIVPSSSFSDGFEKGFNMSAQDRMGEKELTDEKKTAELEKASKAMEGLQEGFRNYFNLVILFFLPFISLGTYFFYKKSGYYYAEHFILNSYILSFQNLIYLLLLPLFFASYAWATAIYLIVAYGFFYYAAQRFFQMKLGASLWRSSLAIVVGYVLYFIAFSIAASIGIALYLKN